MGQGTRDSTHCLTCDVKVYAKNINISHANLPSQNRLLILKGVPTGDSDSSISPLWSRWPDKSSPNCPLTLQSMLPSSLLKAVSRCSTPSAHVLNI